MVSRTSARSNLPTWRYYYNASFPNIHEPGFTTEELRAYHSSDLSVIWGTYPREKSTEQEDALSKFIQSSWAGFVKDPWGAGPGWGRIDESGNGIACLGCNGSSGVSIINSDIIDGRCQLYSQRYLTADSPFL